MHQLTPTVAPVKQSFYNLKYKSACEGMPKTSVVIDISHQHLSSKRKKLPMTHKKEPESVLNEKTNRQNRHYHSTINRFTNAQASGP